MPPYWVFRTGREPGTYSGLTLAPAATSIAARVAATPRSLTIRWAIALPALDRPIRLHVRAPLLGPGGPVPNAAQLLSSRSFAVWAGR